MTWVYISLHNMTISRNSRSSYFPANVTGLWDKWNGTAVMKTPYRLALFHISHSAVLLTTVGGWVLLLSLPWPLFQVSVSLSVQQKEIDSLISKVPLTWILQESSESTEPVIVGPHSMIKTAAPREVAPTRRGMPLSQSWTQVRNLVENIWKWWWMYHAQ